MQFSEHKKAKRDSLSSIKQVVSTVKKDNSISFMRIQEQKANNSFDDSMEAEYILVKKQKDQNSQSYLTRTPPPNQPFYSTAVNISKLSSTTPVSIKKDPKLSRTKQQLIS